MSTNDSVDPPLILPIGHYIGAFYGTPGSTEHTQQVRIGAEVFHLDDPQFTVWALAHGVPARVAEARWTRAELEEAAGKAGVAGAAGVIDEFLAAGSLAEVTPGTPDAVEFGRNYRTVPLMLGLGNTPEEPWLYAVGFPGEPIVKMRGVLYDLWEWGHMDADLWSACEGAAATARRVRIDDPEQNDPERLLTGLLESLHTLLGPHALYLDLSLAA
jgi:hypothetical protein